MPGSQMKWAEKLLGMLINPDWKEELLGDLEEYQQELIQLPRWKQSIYFWFHVLNCVRPSLIKPIHKTQKLNHIGMFKFNARVAFRTLRKHPALTLSSAITLILGTLCFQLIFSWLSNEWSMNQMHQKLDRLYVTGVKTNAEADLFSISLQAMFRVDYSHLREIEGVAQVHTYDKEEIKLVTSSHEYKGVGFVVDSTFLDLFDFKIIAGRDDHPLHDPSSILVTESMALRMYEGENPIGKTLELQCDQQGSYVIAGVIADIPSNSSMYFDFLVPKHSQEFWRRIPQEIVLTKPGLNLPEFNEKLKLEGRAKNQRFPQSELYLIPFQDCYKEAALPSSLFSKYSNKEQVPTLVFVALLIWLMALLGFNNLQSTLQLSQSKKLGLRHVIGGSKWTLSGEVFWSRFYFLLISVGTSFLTYQLIFPWVQTYFNMDLDATPDLDLLGMLAFSLSIVLISTLSGIWLIYRLNISTALAPMAQPFKIPVQQRLLTTFQYIITVVLLITTAVVYQQFRFMTNKNLGFQHTNVISVDFFEISPNDAREQTEKDYQYINNQMMQQPAIISFGQGDLPITQMVNRASWKPTGEGHEYTTQQMMDVDPAYLKLMGLELIEGRFFNEAIDEQNQQKVVLNEAAIQYWQIDDIRNTRLVSNTSGKNVSEFQIIGVVKDYHYQHLSHHIKPLILRYRNYRDDPFLMRFADGQEQAGLAWLEKLYHDINPAGTFEYEALEERIAAQYIQEQQLRKIYLAFTVVALTLSSLCLFTFAFYETHRRTKEIGIRKVMGASANEIFRLFSSSFLKSISLAYLIAVPIGWYFHHTWIEQFAYRTTIGWWIYAGAGLLILIAAFLATSYQTYQISQTNPVQSLRNE